MAVFPQRYLCLLLIAVLAGCGSSEPPAAEKKAAPKAPKKPVTALSAVYKMYVAGRTWAADLEPLEVASLPLTEIPAKDGAYGAWQCTFVSASKRAKKTHTFSLVEKGEQLHEGVFGAAEESYTPGSGSELSFPMAAFRTDSPAALKTALEKGGSAFQAKNPDLPVMFRVQRGKRDASPMMQVFWGVSALSSPYSVFVNADTGDFVKIAK